MTADSVDVEAQETSSPRKRRPKFEPPEDVCYVAGAAISMRDLFVPLLDEWAWYKSQLRNWMLANHVDDMVCPVGGMRVRARLTPTVLVVCTCHRYPVSDCVESLSMIASGQSVTTSIIEEQQLSVSVLKEQ
jgi:hypothetical protein